MTERCKANPCCGEYYGNCEIPLPQHRSGLWFHNTDEYRDNYAVDQFAADMKAKLAKKREEGRGGWDRKEECTAELLSLLLREHVAKGDPLDVGNLEMMLHQRGERIIPAPSTDDVDTCPVCAEPLLDGDTCATDIEMGICHAACLEASPTVDLGTGEEIEDPIDTYRYGDTDPSASRPSGGDHG